MKKLLISLLVCLTISCNSKSEKIAKIDESTFYSKIFNEVDSISLNDSGTFWNVPLNGPLIFIDPETRKFFANYHGSQKSFKKVGTIFTDTLQGDINIANTSFIWQGERWTMVMLPLPKDKSKRNNLIFHELFHNIQPDIGFGNLPEQSNAHLDTYRGRLLLRLELRALLASINSEGKKQRGHISDALRFRKERQNTIEIKDAENGLELNEGLAEYTGLMFSNRSEKEIKKHFTKNCNEFFNNKTFVRSFAYHTVPMYGYLLSGLKKDWQKDIKRESNLTDYFFKSFDESPNHSKTIQTISFENDYDYERIVVEERQREAQHLKAIADYQELFTKKTTLKLSFENMKVSFDPRNIVPLNGKGTVYPNMRISDNWGILNVEKGALMSSDWKFVKVSEPLKINDNIVNGDGWNLELNEGWSIVKRGNVFILSKE